MRDTNVKPTVVIADDHRGMLESLSHLIAPDFEIVATALGGKEAVAAVMRLRPDIAILDICMPGVDGIKAAREIRSSGVPSKIVFLTVHRTADYVRCALEAGGNGFVLKSRMNAKLVTALSEVLSGNVSVYGTAEQETAWKDERESRNTHTAR